MNKLLKQKEDGRRMKQSADFYFLAYHLNLNLDINKLRLEELNLKPNKRFDRKISSIEIIEDINKKSK